MSTELETELRAAFDGAGKSVMPPADLASRVRQAVHRKLAISAVAAVAVLAAAAYLTSSLITGAGRSVPSHPSHHAVTHIIVRTGPSENVDAVAVSGPYLYVATDSGGQPPNLLGVYLRATGRLILPLAVPGKPASLSTGPGNSVWLTFYPDNGGGTCGTWLLSADLEQLSATRKTCSLPLLPTGPDTALTEVGNEQLATLTMPPPGRPGRASIEPRGSVGHYAVVSLVQAGTHIAALVTNDFGFLHVVIAVPRGASFGGRSGPLVLSETSQANGLWVATAPVTSPDAGPLVRLSDTLRPITPPTIKANPILQKSERVWSAGHTVWVATASARHRLVCFSYRAAPGAVVTIPVRGQVAALATEGNTVYVTVANPEMGGEAADVYAYTVPRACH